MVAKPVICLDSDGVFSDFLGFLKEHGLSRGDKNMWGELSKIPNAFYRMKVLPDALKLYAAIKHHRHYVLTAMPRPTGYLATSKEDKIKWWANNVSPDVDVVVVSSGKEKAAHAASNKILIDDLPRNIRMWEDAMGIGILHKSVPETLEALRGLGLLRIA